MKDNILQEFPALGTPPKIETAADAKVEERRQRMRRVERIAWILDNAWRLPGTQIRLGVDSVLGLIPGVGDVASIAISGVLFREAVKLEADTSVLIKMAGNIGIDACVGIIPVLGDLFDVAFRANAKNAKLLREHLAEKHGPAMFHGPDAIAPDATTPDAMTVDGKISRPVDVRDE